jgi:hypothetical protein
LRLIVRVGALGHGALPLLLVDETFAVGDRLTRPASDGLNGGRGREGARILRKTLAARG